MYLFATKASFVVMVPQIGSCTVRVHALFNYVAASKRPAYSTTDTDCLALLLS